ncbi:MAG: histidine kinase [Bacteroidota bacterium]
MPLLKNIYSIVFLAMTCIATSQTLKFEQFTTKDGLLSDEVYNLHQDKKGYIWLFTNYGAMKYNGKTFEPVLKNLPFKESFIYSFYENEKGQKWAANSNGNIFEIINDSAFIVKGTEGSSDKLRKNVAEINQLYVDDSLNIYACSKKYFFKFNKDKGYFPTLLNTNPFKDSIFHLVIEINKNTVLSGFNSIARDSLDVFKSDSVYKIKITSGAQKGVYNFSLGENRACLALKFKHFGERIYFCACSKIYYIENNRIYNDIDVNSFIQFYSKDNRNHLWVGCYNGGLFEFDENHKQINHYMGNKTVNCVLFDSQNGIWISTTGFGLFHCNRMDELYFSEDQDLGKSISLLKIADDKLFIGNSQGDIFLLEDNGLIKRTSNHKLKESLDIIKFNSFYIIASRYGIYKIYESDHSYEQLSSDKHNDNFHAYGIRMKGEDTLICFGRRTVIILRDCKFQKIISSDFKLNFLEVRGNQVFLCTDDGIYELQDGKLIQPFYLSPTKNCMITRAYIDSYHNCWFGTRGCGLFKLSTDNKLFHYTTESGLPSTIVNSISEVPKKGMLLSTNKGLFYNFFNFSNSGFSKWELIYPHDVFNAVEYKGKIYASTKNGLVIFDSEIIAKTPKLYFNIVSVSINSKLYKVFQLNELKHNENNLVFEFDIILFSSIVPDMKYKLMGPVTYSDVTTEQKIAFQNLPPGSYKLIVEPNTDDGNKYKKVIDFNIIPAFWQTNWFFILSVLCIVVFIIYGVWLVFRYYKNKELKRNEAEKIIAEYRLIALKAQINPHFMSNCIAAIQHLILKNKVDEANEYLAKFSFLVRQVLNFSTKSFVTLKEELEIIDLYIKLEKLRFEKINFDLKIDPSVNRDTTFIPPLLLQPIIENAIWHGLLPLENTKNAVLTLSIKLKGDVLKIIIEDNGIGRKFIKEGISNSKESQGIAITKQRIENLKYIVNYDVASLIYEDLVDDKHNPIGTRVIISLPTNLHS